MLSFIATILVLAFLVYKAWPWFWHIVTSLFLALLVTVSLCQRLGGEDWRTSDRFWRPLPTG
jgi:hypothetical protein